MTSPVDTSVKNFHSGMPNSPVLSGTAGSLIALIDACLKDGFNSITPTSIVVSAGVATVTWPSTHASEQDAVVLIAGITGGPTGFADLNGEQKITSKPNATSATFACPTVGNGTATGTITYKMAPASTYWTKVYTGTNKAVYRSTDPAGTGGYLRIDDTGTTSARVVMYETMTDVDTGTNPAPTPAALAGGGYWAKSSVANSTANRWSFFADSRFFMFAVAPFFGQTPAAYSTYLRGFGDMIPYKVGGDAYFCSINFSTQTATASQADGCLDTASTIVCNGTLRSHTGLGTSITNGLYPVSGTALASGNDTLHGNAPSLIDGTIRMSKKLWVPLVATGNPRGEIPGLAHVSMTLAFDSLAYGQTFFGAGLFAGRRMAVIHPSYSSPGATAGSGNSGATLIDKTGPWRT